MLLSQENKILYVANPKTATTSVQDWLQEQDSTFIKTNHLIDGKKVVLGEHITAFQACKLLGDEVYNSLNVIGFVRNPEMKIISAYKFYKQFGKEKKLWSRKTHLLGPRILHVFQFLFARLLPFSLWSLIYPYNDNYRYFRGKDKVIVQYIGRFEYLKNDLELIMKQLGYLPDMNSLKELNTSSNVKEEVISPLLFKLLKIRHPNFKRDIDFYREVSKQYDI